MCFEEEKGFIVIRANFAMYTLLSLFSQISLSFTFLSSFTFNSLFQISLVIVLFFLVTVVPIFMGTVPSIPNVKPR